MNLKKILKPMRTILRIWRTFWMTCFDLKNCCPWCQFYSNSFRLTWLFPFFGWWILCGRLSHYPRLSVSQKHPLQHCWIGLCCRCLHSTDFTHLTISLFLAHFTFCCWRCCSVLFSICIFQCWIGSNHGQMMEHAEHASLAWIDSPSTRRCWAQLRSFASLIWLRPENCCEGPQPTGWMALASS
jgi:hypothetical protein